MSRLMDHLPENVKNELAILHQANEPGQSGCKDYVGLRTATLNSLTDQSNNGTVWS